MGTRRASRLLLAVATVETALIFALVAPAIVLGVDTLGDGISGAFAQVSDTLTMAAERLARL